MTPIGTAVHASQKGPITLSRKLLCLTLSRPAETPHLEWPLWSLSKAGWHINAISPSGNKNLIRTVLGETWPTDRLRFVPESNRFISELSVIVAMIKAWFSRCDVLYIYGHGISSRIGLLALMPMRARHLVYHGSELYNPSHNRVRWWLEGLLLRRCSLVLHTEYHLGYVALEQRRAKCPAAVAPPNLCREWPIPAWNPDLRRHLVGDGPDDAFVLRMHEIFQALAMLPERFRLAMTEEHSAEANARVQARLEELRIAERVVRLPRMQFQEMLGYTVCSDVGLLLYRNGSLNDFFTSPGRLTEYLACGLPLLASNFTGLQLLLLQYDLGECVEGHRPESIAEGLLRLDSAKQAGRYPRERMRRTFEEEFAFELW